MQIEYRGRALQQNDRIQCKSHDDELTWEELLVSNGYSIVVSHYGHWIDIIRVPEEG